MIIDFHTHVGIDCSDEEYERLDFSELKKSMDRWGIDKSVVFPFNYDDKELIEESLKILEKSKSEDWIIPFLRFNPNVIDKDELIVLLDKGFKGMKLHPRAQNFKVDDKKIYWIYELCSDKKIPILFHCSIKDNESHPSKILRVAEKFPNLNIIMAHFFGNDFDIMKIVNKYPNLYVDTSMNSGTLKRKQTVEKYGFNRLVFGSDAPYDSQGIALMKIEEAGLSEKDKELIFSGNAVKILNLGGNKNG